MTDLDLLTDLHEKASPIPWQVAADESWTTDPPILFDPGIVYVDPEALSNDPALRHDAELLVAMRNALPDLIAAARERDRLAVVVADVRALADEWKREADDYRGYIDAAPSIPTQLDGITSVREEYAATLRALIDPTPPTEGEKP